METERRNEPVREFRLEGVGVVVVGGLLLIAFGLTFWAGRVWERRQAPPREVTALTVDPLERVEGEAAEATDAAEEMTFFDTLGGEGKEAEPARQARPPAAAEPVTRTAAPSAPAMPAMDRDGQYFVQVFAGRLRRSAEDLVRKLDQEGYAARLDSERDGQDQLFKVRVGGFATRSDADAAAARLQDQGYPTAWVVVPG